MALALVTDLPFLTVAVGALYSVPVDLAVKIVSEKAFGKVCQKDAIKLLESCLDDTVKEKSTFLRAFTSQSGNLDSNGAYLDKKRLREFFDGNPLVRPFTSEVLGSNSWRPYLKPFQEIIVIPGICLNEEDHLDIIQMILEYASRRFNARVPSEHPAFEQIMLQHQAAQELNHREILDGIKEIPGRTAQVLAQQNDSLKETTIETLEPPWINPFSVVATDHLDLTNPEHVKQLRNLFISRYSELPIARKYFHTVLEGQRGTGKTTILKHLAFETQIQEWNEKEKRNKDDFLKNDGNFIGVYSKLSLGVFDKSDFRAIEEPRKSDIFEHRLVLQLLFSTLETMKSVFRIFHPEMKESIRIRQTLTSYLELDAHTDTYPEIEDFLTFAQDHISNVLILSVDEHLRSVSPGSPQGATQFNPRLTLSGQLIPLLKLLSKACGAVVPFFLLLDDFDVLDPWQQTRVLRTAASRDFSIACFKFGLMIYGMKTSLAGPERTFREGDDYDLIDLDWTQGGLHANYREAVLEIAAARLRESQWPTDLDKLLPKWPRGQELLDEVREQMDREWTEAVEKPTASKSDYFSKYGDARFFQLLRSRKIRMRYSGLDTVVMVSSGIFRQFLEACKLIFDRAHDRGWNETKGGVGSEVQDAALREYSVDMVQQFTRTSGDSQTLAAGDPEVTSLHMITLIDALCDAFYSRLHTVGYREPENLCVAIRDGLDNNSDASTYIRTAVRESILHRLHYPPKTAGGPDLPTFMLNRRLGPRRDLSITRMQGRIEILAADILVAVSDRASFQRNMNRVFNRRARQVKGAADAEQRVLDDME